MFNIRLINIKNIKNIKVVDKKFKYDKRYDSEISFLDELSIAMYKQNCFEFNIMFDGKIFNINTRMGLSYFFENIDKAFEEFAYEYGSFKIDFINQAGMQQLLFCFNIDDDRVEIHWEELYDDEIKYKSETIIMQTKDVIKMFEDVRDTFYELASHIYPSITNHPAFKEWYKKLFIEYYD